MAGLALGWLIHLKRYCRGQIGCERRTLVRYAVTNW